MPYGVDAVEQFQVVTSGGQAELGRALGGYVNVVTKSGTNALHGDLYDYLRDDRVQRGECALGHEAADEPEAVSAAAWADRSSADRTFFFANVEQRRLDQSGLVTISEPTSARHQREAGGGRLPGSPVATGMYPNPVDTTNVLGQGRSPVQRPGSVQRALQPVSTPTSEQLPRRRRLERAQRVGRPGQHRSTSRSATR